MSILRKSFHGAITVAALLAPVMFGATNFIQTNLIADTDGVAPVTDPNMVGTWGISVSAGSPFWVSNAANGTSTVFTISYAIFCLKNKPVIATTTLVAAPPSATNSA